MKAAYSSYFQLIYFWKVFRNVKLLGRFPAQFEILMHSIWVSPIEKAVEAFLINSKCFMRKLMHIRHEW